MELFEGFLTLRLVMQWLVSISLVIFLNLFLRLIRTEMDYYCQFAHRGKLDESKCVFTKIRERLACGYLATVMDKIGIIDITKLLWSFRTSFNVSIYPFYEIVQLDCECVLTDSSNENDQRKNVEEGDEPGAIALLLPEVLHYVIDACCNCNHVNTEHDVDFNVQALNLFVSRYDTERRHWYRYVTTIKCHFENF